MGMFCSRVVEACGEWWAYVGWGLVLGAFILRVAPANSPVSAHVRVAALVLMLAWWLTDVVDQQVPRWVISVGMTMLAISLLPRGWFLMVAAWAIYWTRVRE